MWSSIESLKIAISGVFALKFCGHFLMFFSCFQSVRAEGFFGRGEGFHLIELWTLFVLYPSIPPGLRSSFFSVRGHLYITRISSCILPFNKSSLVRFTSLVLRHKELVRRPEAEFVFSLSNHGHSGLFSDLSEATAQSSHYLGQFHYQVSKTNYNWHWVTSRIQSNTKSAAKQM